MSHDAQSWLYRKLLMHIFWGKKPSEAAVSRNAIMKKLRKNVIFDGRLKKHRLVPI